MRVFPSLSPKIIVRIHLALLFFAAMLLLTACAPFSTGPFNNYYVSLSGSDTAGDGSMGNPWRTIMHAVNNADYRGDTPRIHIGPGEYVENLYLLRDVVLQGAGGGEPPLVGDVGPITYITWATPPVGRGGAHIIVDSNVELHDMSFNVGRVSVVGGRFHADNVWFIRQWGLFGLQLREVEAFTIIGAQFRTPELSDYGLNIINSTGEVLGGYWGTRYDHAIVLSRFPAYGLMIVNIDGVEIDGSDICYADGIRISGAPIVTISNSDIRRVRADAEAPCADPLSGTITSDGVAAGIGVQRVPTGGGVSTITLRGNITEGFDVGFAFDVRRVRVRAENNTIAGRSYGVLAWRWPSATNSTGAVLDFGGGTLGSVGGNTFQPFGRWAFYTDEDYDIMACDNDWSVPNDQVDPDRIFDQLDDASKGRVMWGCASEPIIAESPQPTQTLVQILTLTPTPEAPGEIIVILNGNARCRKGPGTAYEDHDFFSLGNQTVATGRNSDASWLVVNALNNGGTCWVGRGVLDIEASDAFVLALPEVIPPPPPTATPTPTAPQGTAPAAPQQASWDGQVCTQNAYTVTISWVDAANNETGYRILRNGAEIALLPANSNKYIDNPPYGGPYTYTIRAYNDFGTAQAQVQDAGCLP
jgi:hypothetical protein